MNRFGPLVAMVDEQKRHHILIVDDTPINVELLTIVLETQYLVSTTDNGKDALRLAKEIQPDLILLDVVMAGMNGYEVCMRLKGDSATSRIPVIFVTAMEADTDEERGFVVGGADYITKPISPTVVLARIATHLALYDQKNSFEAQLKARTQELEASNRALEKALRNSQKADLLKKEFLGTIGHELRTPLNGITGALQLLKFHLSGDEAKSLHNMAYWSAAHLQQMLDNILSFIELQAGELVSSTESTNLLRFL